MSNFIGLALFINFVLAAILYVRSGPRKEESKPERRLPPDWCSVEVDGEFFYADINDPNATTISRVRRQDKAA